MLLLRQRAHPKHPTPPKMVPKESKPVDHNTCVNTPPSHNQEGNILNYSDACARCEAGLFTSCVPMGMTIGNVAAATLCLDGQQMVFIEHSVLPYPVGLKVKIHTMAPWE